MPRVVAVICAFWPARIENLKRIVGDLKAGSVVPDRIIILNNNKNFKLDKSDFEGVDIINSEFNSRTRGKFVVALLDVADYYLTLDDDCSVSPKTLEAFLRYAHRKCCFGVCGISQSGGNDQRIYSTGVTEETPTETFLGGILFLSFYAIVRMLIAEERIRITTKWKHEGEDLLMGLANNSMVVPLKYDENWDLSERWKEFDWGPEAISYGSDGSSAGGPDYLRMRNEFTLDAMKILKENPLPEF
jgi:hypothetical protein